MKYRKASDVLPDKLLKEIQKYASGEVIYIPASEKRKGWGESSGTRQFYFERNEEIRQKYFGGGSIELLAEEYALSIDTIRKIVYK